VFKKGKNKRGLSTKKFVIFPTVIISQPIYDYTTVQNVWLCSPGLKLFD